MGAAHGSMKGSGSSDMNSSVYSSVPGPDTAVFRGYAPRAPIQKRHAEQIYYGER
jgi:hypothetical protein